MGVAFPFIRRLLSFNGDDYQPVEVVLLSKNDPDTGLRVMNSIEAHDLGITRAAFTNGRSPYGYIPAFNVGLFLSANEDDVKEAIMQGHPAGQVLDTEFQDDPIDEELRIALDFDGVIADDAAERIYQRDGIDAFHAHEREKAEEPHAPGPMATLLHRVAEIQQHELQKAKDTPGYKPRIRIAIVTARNAPSHARLVATLRHWGINVDETFFLGGIDKRDVLEVFRPHIFFDDQLKHLSGTSGLLPSVHVPFGVTNRAEEE